MGRHIVQSLMNRSCGGEIKNADEEENPMRRKFRAVTDKQIVRGESQKADREDRHVGKDPVIEILITFVTDFTIDLKKEQI